MNFKTKSLYSKIWVICLCFIFVKSNLFAQEEIRYSTKNGLISNHIYDIQEDKDGFMWFATNRGLFKFDGEKFKIFNIQNGLPNNDTWELELDYQGKLWYFSKSSYQGYILNDSIYKFQLKKVISPRIFFKSKDKFWFNGSDTFIYLNKDTIKQTFTPLQFIAADSLNTYALKNNINPLSNGKIYNPKSEELIFVRQDSILFYDKNLRVVERIKQNQKFPNEPDMFISLTGMAYNEILYQLSNFGVLFINSKTKQTDYICFNDYIEEKKIEGAKVTCLKNEIQIRFPRNLLVYNYQLELLKHYSFPDYPKNKISYRDSKGNIWLANLTEGITFIPKTQIDAKYYLGNKKTQKIREWHKQLLAGVHNVGILQYNKDQNIFESFNELKSNSHGNIYQIKENPDYFITSNKSYLHKDNNLSEIDFQISPEYNNFKYFTKFKESNYFISSMYVLKDKEIKTYKEGLLQAMEYKQKLYFGGSDGLFIFQNDSLARPSTRNTLLYTSILSLYTDSNKLFVGTDGRGVYCYDEERIIHLKSTDGLSINRIEKRENALWLATQNGVKKVSLNTSDIKTSKITNNFNDADGLHQNNINDIVLIDSLLYSATDLGLSCININNDLYSRKPEIYFSDYKDSIVIESNQRNNVTISFSAKEFINQKYLSYHYRLLPLEDKWIPSESKSLNFSNLSPENYNLEVKVIDQHFNSSIIKKNILVLPFWYETIYANVVFLVLFVLIILILFRWYKNNIIKKEIAKAHQEKKIAGLELQALRSQMNPHFVHNSLNAIQYYIQRNEVELSEKYLVKFSKLIRLFFEYSRRHEISILEEIHLLNNYLAIEKLRFEEKLSYKINIDEELDIEEQRIPSMILQPIVENAINHGLFHKLTNGKVNVYFNYLNEHTFQVVVKDDGIGINKSKSLYNNTHKKFGSNSSNVLNDRIKLLNQGNTWQIQFEIFDRSELPENSHGTIVELTFHKIDIDENKNNFNR